MYESKLGVTSLFYKRRYSEASGACRYERSNLDAFDHMLLWMTSPPNIRLDIIQLICESFCEIRRGETDAATSFIEAERSHKLD